MRQLMKSARGVVSGQGQGAGAAGVGSSPAVSDALAELQRLEAEAATAVSRRAAATQAHAQTQTQGGSTGAGATASGKKHMARSGLSGAQALEPKALSAWEQLQLEEAEAERRFKELVCTNSKRK